MRKYYTTILLMITLPIQELHKFWAGDMHQSNWILKAYRPMIPSWNITFVAIEVCPVLYFAAWKLYQKNRINDTTVTAFLVFMFFDLIAYFYNFKQYGFGMVYFWFTWFWLLSYHKQQIWKLFKTKK